MPSFNLNGAREIFRVISAVFREADDVIFL